MMYHPSSWRSCLSLFLSALYIATCVLAHVPPGYSPPHGLESRSTESGCQQLKAKYPNLVFFPGSTTYTLENTSECYQSISFWQKASLTETLNNIDFYSSSAILSPACVFKPSLAQHIAGALSVLRATNTKFGVRGGGHTPIAGAASANHGVLIAMTSMNKNQLGTFGGDQVAKIGPGQRWVDVYSWLAQYNLMVVGGRYA